MKRKGEDFTTFAIVVAAVIILMFLILASLDFWNCHYAAGQLTQHCHSLFTPAHVH